MHGCFTNKSITEIPFIVPAQRLSDNPLGIKERDGWLDNIYPRQKKYYTNLLSTGVELALQGLGAIYIPNFIANKINASRKTKQKLVEYPLAKKRENTASVFLLSHVEQKNTYLFKTLSNMIKSMLLN